MAAACCGLRVGVVALLGLVPALFSIPSSAQLAVALGERQVAVTGVSPGGEVALLSVWRQRLEDVTTRVTRLDELLADADGDGALTLDLDQEIPTISLWAAVDAASGEVAVALPEGFRYREIEAAAVRELPGLVLEIDRRHLELLAVRPGVGVWTLALRDGGPGDADAVYDGKIVVDALAFEPAGPAPPLGVLLPGDVVVALDSRHMELAAIRLGP